MGIILGNERKEKMSSIERNQIFEKIKTIRNNPVIAYVTSVRNGQSWSIGNDAITSIIAAIQSIPEEFKELDFIIISNGGDPIAAQRLISFLRERFNKITVMLPYVAYSAATILALGADEIIMHPFSNLGPVDPQLSFVKRDYMGQNTQYNYSSEDIQNYIAFLKEDVGISDQKYLAEAIANLNADVGAIHIGGAKRSQQLSLTLSEKLLVEHTGDKGLAEKISRQLNSLFYHHGYAVSRKEAKDMGLKVIYPDKELEGLLWKLWLDYADEMQMNSDFDIMNEMMKQPEFQSWLENISDLEKNMYLTGTQFATEQAAIPNTGKTIKFDSTLACIESNYTQYKLCIHYAINVWRRPDLSIGNTSTYIMDAWKRG